MRRAGRGLRVSGHVPAFMRARGAVEAGFDSAPVHDVIRRLVDRGTVIDPSLATFDFLRQKDGTLSPACAAVADHSPPPVGAARIVDEREA